MERSKFCPFRAADCSDLCGFFDTARKRCSVVSIANSLNDIAMSTDDVECHIEDIPDKLDNVCAHLSDIYNAV